jgi:anti-sigma28 factor (negative regulator of flagellin synthesis)
MSGASAQEVVGNMKITTDNDSSLMSSPVLKIEAVSPHEPDAIEPTGAGEKPALSLRLSSELARGLACMSEEREAKIHELQESIDNGTYHTTAEQIADKMLRHILRPDLA